VLQPEASCYLVCHRFTSSTLWHNVKKLPGLSTGCLNPEERHLSNGCPTIVQMLLCFLSLVGSLYITLYGIKNNYLMNSVSSKSLVCTALGCIITSCCNKISVRCGRNFVAKSHVGVMLRIMNI
jgi:hypothetical protein